MPVERPVEPTLVQHVEAVRDELRAEQQALEALPLKNAQLREQREQLERRKQELRGEIEALRQGLPASPPRLPEVLSPPFTVKARPGLRGPLLNLLFFMCLVAAVTLVPHGLQAWRWVAAIWALLGLLVPWLFLAPPRWYFGPTAVRLGGFSWQPQSPRSSVSYREIEDVQVLVTHAQRRRGVGTVVLSCRGASKERWVILRHVPEPERLAEWIRSQLAKP